MTLKEYAGAVGYSEGHLSRCLSAKKLTLPVGACQKLATGGCMTPAEWHGKTPAQKKRLWRAFCQEQDAKLLEVLSCG